MTLALDPRMIAALLEWQAELGADEYIADAPIDRLAVAAPAAVIEAATPVPAPASTAPALAPSAPADPLAAAVAAAQHMAAAAGDLAELAAAQANYPHCELRRGARNFVFADGRPGARVMLVGEAPGAEEERRGKPFVGAAGQLLDRMLAAIGLDRQAPDPGRAVYIANVLPWRPPGNRDPAPDEIAMMRPFITRHIELAAPDLLVLIGNHSCQALLSQRGITRLRGQWQQVLDRPALPMLHPAYLLRNPAAKALSWADLLSLQARLRAS